MTIAAPPSEPANTTRGPSAAVAVAFMFVSLGAMVVSIILALLLQSTVGYLLATAMYGVKFAIERRHGITSPLSVALLGVYALLAGMSWMDVDFAGYAGVIVMSSMTVLVGGLLAIGRPFSSFYSNGRGLPQVHRAVSWIWLGTYASAISATLLLIPHIAFLFVPIGILLIGAVLTLVANFWWCGPELRRREQHVVNDLEVIQIDHDSLRFEEFCTFYATAIFNDPRQSDGRKTRMQIADAVRAAELTLAQDSVIFACLHKGAIVGSIRCVLDRPGRAFPTEVEGGFRLDPLRRRGERLMAVGRLAIAPAMKMRPDVIEHLFGSFVDLALERDITFVLSAGFSHVLSIYRRVGFNHLFPASDPRYGVRMSHGFVSHPVLLNFRRMIFDRVGNDQPKTDLKGTANLYLAERWYKRALLRRWIRNALGRTVPESIDEVRALLDPSPHSEASPTSSDAPNGAAHVRNAELVRKHA